MTVVRHPPLRSQIAQVIKDAIVGFEFAPGEVLVERDLCERTGASRPSVREALRQLEGEGLVESRNGRGTVVRVVSAEEAGYLYEVRAELEGLAAQLFCERAPERLRKRFGKEVRRLEEAFADGLDAKAYVTAQQQFYNTLFAGAANPFLDQTIQGIQVRVAQLRVLTLGVPGRPAQSLREFQAIAAAIESGDPAKARAAAAAHVRAAAEAMRQGVASAELAVGVATE